MKFLIVLLSILGVQLCSILAMETKTSIYSLPSEIDKNKLIPSSVMLECGYTRGTGVAIGDRYILTAAHNIAPHVLDKVKINCCCLRSGNNYYKEYVNLEKQQNHIPNSYSYDDFRPLNIIKIHLPNQTIFKEVGEEQTSYDLVQILEKYKEAMEYGIESTEKLASYGVLTSFMRDEEFVAKQVRTFGPDVAILECDMPHNLPIIDISDPIEAERPMVHILGLAGRRYNSSFDLVGGVVCTVNNKRTCLFQPRIIGQRFKCLPGYSSGEKCWFNRPFIKIIDDKFLLEDEIYPKAPDGFGLIAGGDSGSGAFIIRDGKPLLVGVASIGHIDPMFSLIQDYLAGLNFDMSKTKGLLGASELLQCYLEALQTTDPNKKWFITQGLADVTHLKDWINSIINRQLLMNKTRQLEMSDKSRSKLS